MYIQPNTSVWVFKDVPFDEHYEHTRDFSNKAQQWSYLLDNYLKYYWIKNTYQRASRNSIKVEKKYDDLYDCNYMAFTNINYGDKVFYCFIKEVKYINDNVTEIVYEIDPLQTWMFDYALGSCFVEREHAPDDAIGANLVPENLDCGDYISSFITTPVDCRDLVVTLFCTVDETYSDTHGVIANGMYSGLYPVNKNSNGQWFDLNQAGCQRCADWIRNIPLLKTGCVKMAVVMPKHFADRTHYVESTVEITPNETLLRKDGTQVRNNKCLCYPYNFLYVSNNHGKMGTYKYEYFTLVDGKCVFSLNGDMTPDPSILLAPKNYNGVIGDNYDESLILSGYPQVAFNVDAFNAWLAQCAGGLATSALTMAYTGQMSEATNQLGGKILKYGGIHGVISGIVCGTIAGIQPPQSMGAQQGSAQVAAGIQNFLIYNKKIRPEFATIIDDYFQAYGYACHQVKVPNTKSRIKWNYVKTVGAIVHGDLPNDEAERIRNIYDNGVTFWHYGATMYDYDTANNTVL